MSTVSDRITINAMEIDEVSIMDINFTTLSRRKLKEEKLFPSLINQSKKFLVTANPEIIMNTTIDANYKNIMQHADFIVPDGVGVVFASRILKFPIKERIPGFELMMDLLSYANHNKLTCYFLGSEEHVIPNFIKKIKKEYPNVIIAGFNHGYFKNDSKIVNEICQTKPDLVFVAMGSPLQEKWIFSNYEKFTKGLFMGVGGSFDVLAGNVKRAPKLWINLNLEWLYRLIKQPFRLKRVMQSLKFIFIIIFRRR